MGSAESSYPTPNRAPLDVNWKPTGRVLLYVDNSNLYISTQTHAGKEQKFPDGVKDFTCRMYLDILLAGVVKERNVNVRNAYGVMDDKVVGMLRKQGIKVIPSPRSYVSGREKEADTQITADAVEDIILKKPPQGNPNGDTVVLFSGDQDMCPLIKKARDYGWNVEVWAYTDSLAEAIKTEARQANDETMVRIMPLEDHFERFTYYDNRDFNQSVPEERSLLLTFKDGVPFMNGLDNEKKVAIKEMVINTAKQVFKLPVALKSLESGTQDIHCALIITLPEKDKTTGKSCYKFSDVLVQSKEFQEAATNYMRRNFGGNQRLEVIKYSSFSCGTTTCYNPKTTFKDENGYKDTNNTARSFSNTSTILPKSDYCKGYLPGKFPCKFDSGRCKFAHSRDELKCYTCGMTGNHPTKECKKGDGGPSFSTAHASSRVPRKNNDGLADIGNLSRSSSNISITLHKSEYCRGILPGRAPCRYDSATCKFAHSRDELQCNHCGMRGNHPASKCRKLVPSSTHTGY